MTWREYHEATKHSRESLRRADYALDWANQPDPFRHYEGVPLRDLPADPPAPESPAAALRGADFLSRLLFYSASISAWKRAPSGATYALRVNPSSGNLHPTEFHFATRGLQHWQDGLYHYRPSSHMAEQRALGDFVSQLPVQAPIVFLLTSVVWREAWKYRARAYRYCLLDMGHASEALALAAQALGCRSVVTGEFAEHEVAELCRLSADEWPMLLVTLHGTAIPVRAAEEGGETVWFRGEANPLSAETIVYPAIEGVHAATQWGARPGEGPLPAPPLRVADFGGVVRGRRSALNFVGNAGMSFEQLGAILSATDSRLIQLYVYAHQVEGLAAGVYRFWPERGELEPRRMGDQRVMAAALSLGQELAGNACVAFSMMADLERAERVYAASGYRQAHFEAGATGQRLYLAAEAAGLRGTGIGAFFDDEVNRYLGVAAGEGQVVYHFAIGQPMGDGRLEA